MLLLGHRFIPSENLYHIADIEAVPKTPPGSTIYLEFDENNLDIIDYLRANAIDFALGVETLRDVIYANALGAKYIVTEDSLCKEAQEVANEYLFDAKIVVRIIDDDRIERFAKEGIDGIIYPEAIIKVTT